MPHTIAPGELAVNDGIQGGKGWFITKEHKNIGVGGNAWVNGAAPNFDGKYERMGKPISVIASCLGVTQHQLSQASAADIQDKRGRWG